MEIHQEATIMLRIVKVLSIAVIVLGLAAGTVSASQESVPGSALYGLKLQYENWQLAFGEDPEVKLQMAMTMMQARVQEAVKLAAGGQEIPESVAVRYQAQMAFALQSLGELTGEPQHMQLQAGVSEELAVQMRTMTQLQTMLKNGECEEDCIPEPLRMMMHAGTMAQKKLGVPEDLEPGPKGPANPPEEPGAETPDSPVMMGPFGPARYGNAFEGDDPIVPIGPKGPMQIGGSEYKNPNAPCGNNEECVPPAGPNPNRPEEPAGPAEPFGPGEPQGIQNGVNNQGPEQNQNQGPVDGDPNNNSGGDNGDPNANSGGDQGGSNSGGH